MFGGEPFLSSEWLVGSRSRDGQFVRLTRTSVPLSLEVLRKLEPLLLEALPLARRGALGLLYDGREGPLLVDAQLEKKLREASAFLFDGFDRKAVLVRTAVGGLQARRFGREHRNETQVFDDEAEAIAFLTG